MNGVELVKEHTKKVDDKYEVRMVFKISEEAFNELERGAQREHYPLSAGVSLAHFRQELCGF
jgi:hypothetical protein